MYKFPDAKWNYFMEAASEIKSLNDLVNKVAAVPHVTEFIGTLFWELLGEHPSGFTPLDPPTDEWHNISLPFFLNDSNWEELKRELAGDKVNACIAAIHLNQYFVANTIKVLAIPELLFDVPDARKMQSYAQEEGLTAQVEELEEEIKSAYLAIANFNSAIASDSSRETIKNYARYAVRLTLERVKGELLPGSTRGILPGFIKTGTGLASQVNTTQLFCSEECKMGISALGWLKAGQGKKKIKTETHAVSGVTLGNELSALLPQEWLKSNFEFGASFAEEKLWQYKNGKESGKAGDFFLLCDWSGSMTYMVEEEQDAISSKGQISRSAWAKAIFLKLWEIAIEQDRSIHFVPFETYVRENFCATVGKRDTEDLAKILNAKPSGGGTSWQPPLEWAIEKIKSESRLRTRNGKYKHSDMLYVTDADSFWVSDDFVRKLKAVKKALNFSVHVVLVSAANSNQEQKLLDTIADKVINLGRLRNQEFASAANSVLLEYE